MLSSKHVKAPNQHKVNAQKQFFSILLSVILLTAVFLGAGPAVASECDIGDSTLQSQQAIDRFQQDFGETLACTIAVGNLTIKQALPGSEAAGDPVRSLAGLSDLREIRGALAIVGNPELETLSGLEALERATVSLRIADNAALRTTADLAGLIVSPVVTIENNPALEDIQGLSRFRGEYTGLEVYLISNDSLTSLQGMRGLFGTLTRLVIEDNGALENLDGLEGLTDTRWGLTLKSNPRLSNIDALSGLRGDIGGLEIVDNRWIRNLDPFQNVTRVQRLLLVDNAGLENIFGLFGLQGSVGPVVIEGNPRLRDIDALVGLSQLGDTRITGNAALEDINGLVNVRAAGPTVVITDNPALENLDGLTFLERVFLESDPFFIYNDLIVTGNTSLTDCGGLGPLLGYPTVPYDPNGDSIPRNLVIDDTNGEGAQSPEECLASYAQRLPGQLPEFDLALHGSWYDPATDGEGFMMFTAPNGILSAYFYSYTPEGQPLWQVAFNDEVRNWNEPIELLVYDTSGGTFTNLDPNAVSVEPIGTMTLTVWDCQTGRMDIDVPGNQRSLALDRLGTVVDSPCNNSPRIAPPLPVITTPFIPSLTGAWFDPATDGQGFTLHHVNRDLGLVYFYGYRDDGSDLWLVAPWESSLGFGQTNELELFEFRNVRNSAANPESFRVDATGESWGTLNIRIDDCETAEASLDGVDGQQTLQLQLLAGADGLECLAP